VNARRANRGKRIRKYENLEYLRFLGCAFKVDNPSPGSLKASKGSRLGHDQVDMIKRRLLLYLWLAAVSVANHGTDDLLGGTQYDIPLHSQSPRVS
jgi:hypothetical protein